MSNKGRQFISDLKAYTDYLKWDEDLNRYETWQEACDKVLETHYLKYGDKVVPYLNEVRGSYHDKEFLASQRNLQFRGEQILAHNAKMYNCFDVDEKFVTSEGVKSFSDFIDGDEITVLSHKGKWRRAVVKSYGSQMLYNITFKKGKNKTSIKATKDHRWILSDGSETTELQVGDRVYKPHNTFSEFNYDNATPFEKLYWCYGMVYGDGTRVKNKNGDYAYSMLRLCGEDTKYLPRFEEMGFKSSSSLSLQGDVMVYTGKYLKTAPDPTVDNPELIKAFVSGYLCADGAKNRNRNGKKYISIQSSEKDHIDFIRSCFPIAGIWIISETDYTGQETNFGIRGETISFRISDTMGSKYNAGWKVDTIEEYGERVVWCLEVEDDHSFTMPNGIVTGNCCVGYAYSPDIFNKGFYILLCGTGLGINLKRKFVSQLPELHPRGRNTKLYTIPDSIEGWAEASKVLISSYVSHPSMYEEYYGYNIKFDYSQIRPKGALITGGFKAPGPDGLKQSLERIETLINNYLQGTPKEFKSIIAYDIFMHLSDAVLSGGVRRSAMNILMDVVDEELINAKTGNWREKTPWRARSNNSVGLLKGEFSKELFTELVNKNEGDNDLGFVFMNHEDEMFNPCFEIAFNFYSQIRDLTEAVFQFCNLNEINASACTFKTSDNFSEEKFYELCRHSAIVGTLQAGYTDFPYLGQQTNDMVAGEALLGVSITGWMMMPDLFNEEILRKGAQIVKDTNAEVATLIDINTSARSTTVKPSGNASVILQTESGIHPAHSKRGFRLMQLNKDSETAKYLEEHQPEILEESRWSATNSDYIVYATYENPDGTMYKEDMQGIKHLELIRLVQNSWVTGGKRPERCYNPLTNHNVSNTVIIDDKEEIVDYLYANQEDFTAVAFIGFFGDKDYAQAPFTSVLDTDELLNKYGDGVIFMSGLIVDGLHYFNGDLWNATQHVKDPSLKLEGSREQVLLKKDWLRRVKKYAKNYFKKDIEQTVYCMKDVHLWHKYTSISRDFRPPKFEDILTKPDYQDVDKYGSLACSGGSCEIPSWALGQMEAEPAE